MRMTLANLVEIFTSPSVHPARKGLTRKRSEFGKAVSGNSKWHRRVLAAGLKDKC
jgi:hypothetical protein